MSIKNVKTNKTSRGFAPDPANYVYSKSATKSVTKIATETSKMSNKHQQITSAEKCTDPEKTKSPFFKTKNPENFF